MSTDVTQFRNTSGPSTTRELCKSVSHFDIIMADTYTVGKRKLNQAGILILKGNCALFPCFINWWNVTRLRLSTTSSRRHASNVPYPQYFVGPSQSSYMRLKEELASYKYPKNAQNNQEISYNSISSWFQRRRTLLQKQALRQSTTSSTPRTSVFPNCPICIFLNCICLLCLKQ